MITSEYKYRRFDDIYEILKNTYVSKNTTYGDSFAKSLKDIGLIAGTVRIYDKVQRAISIIKGAENNIADESLWNTFKDAAVYNIMMIELELLEKERTSSAIVNPESIDKEYTNCEDRL